MFHAQIPPKKWDPNPFLVARDTGEFQNIFVPQQSGGMEIYMGENLFAEIYEVVKRIPRGKVATYGQVAALTGNPKRARIVGYALHVNPCPGVIPCHRVVNRFGSVAPAFAFGGQDVQAEMLRAEGVEVSEDGVVDLERYQWKPSGSAV